MKKQPPKQDMVTHTIQIDAPREQVFALASQPGWWLGDEAPSIYEVVAQDGESTMLKHPKYGQFTFIARSLAAPERATFLWSAGQPDDNAAAGKTVVEFWLEEKDGGTAVTVEETGFSALKMTDDEHANAIAANTEGWQGELELLKRRAESRRL